LERPVVSLDKRPAALWQELLWGKVRVTVLQFDITESHQTHALTAQSMSLSLCNSHSRRFRDRITAYASRINENPLEWLTWVYELPFI